jgi:hypothetical protein
VINTRSMRNDQRIYQIINCRRWFLTDNPIYLSVLDLLIFSLRITSQKLHGRDLQHDDNINDID